MPSDRGQNRYPDFVPLETLLLFENYSSSHCLLSSWRRFHVSLYCFLRGTAGFPSNGLHYKYRPSFRVIITNQLSSVNFSSYGFLSTEIKQVSFFENSAWTMTKALCLNPMAA